MLENPPDDPLRALTGDPFLDDPRPLYDWLRRHHPVYPMRPGQLVLSRYHDAHQLVRDPRFRRASLAEIAARLPAGASDRRAMRMMYDSVAFANPPRHTRLRKVISRELTNARVAALAEQVTRLSDRLLDDVEERLRSGETVDMHADFTVGLARTVMADLLGVPEEDRDWMGALVNGVIAVLDPSVTAAQLDAADEACRQVDDYLNDLARRRRADPKDDLISAWANPDDERIRLDEDELSVMMTGMWLAGFESTASGIDHGLLLLSRHPECGHWLDGGPERAAAFVDEVVRCEPQVMMTSISWLATEDIVIGESTVPAGWDVRMLIGAVNHDPDAYPEPDRFDPGRPSTRNFSFYQGPHYCVGHALAKMELSVALSAVHRRLPGLTLVGPPQRVPTLSLRRFDRLPMAL